MEPFDKSPELSREDWQTADRFHILWYRKMCFERPTFMGIRCIKNPFDLWIYQELIHRTRPDLIIETGSFEGGSALYLSCMQQLFLGKGRVITIDLDPKWSPLVIDNPDIITIKGDSTSREVLDRVIEYHQRCQVCMVILDSDHHKEHVFREMVLWGPLVTKGSYLIVEDGNVNGHPVWEDYGPGPFEAIEQFLTLHSEFEAVRELEQKFYFSFVVKGFLKRV